MREEALIMALAESPCVMWSLPKHLATEARSHGVGVVATVAHGEHMGIDQVVPD